MPLIRKEKAEPSIRLQWILVAVIALPAIMGTVLYCWHLFEDPGTSRFVADPGQREMSHIKAALGIFELDNSRFPSTGEGLNALVECPAELAATWKGKYLDRIPLDYWEQPFEYMGPDAMGEGRFRLRSAGPDGVMGNADDLVR